MSTTSIALEKTVQQAVNADEAWQTVVDLSTTIRLSGNADEAKAIDYLTAKLTTYGVDYTLHNPTLFVSWPQGATLRVLGEDGFSVMAKTPAMSVSTNGKEVEGDLHYLETGWAKGVMSLFNAVELGDIDLTGKIVITEGLPMPGKVADISARGAVAAVFIGPGERIHEGVCTTIWGSPDLDSMNRQPTIPIIAINKPEGQKLIARAKVGDVRVAFSTQHDTQWRPIPILVAEIKGTVAPDEFILLHGHLDGWHYGIGDNLTGDATMLEIARVLQQQQGNLQRSVRIAWWSGHSHGRYAGSTWFADTFGLDLAENCVAQVNCDSPGCRWATVYTNVMWTEETGPLIRDAIRDVTGEEALWARPLRAGDYSFNNIGLSGFLMLSSTMPDELREEKGYYAVGGCGGNIAWHTEDDLLEIGDKDNLARDIKLYATSILRVANAVVPAFDFRLTLDGFKATVAEYQGVAGDRFDLSPALPDIDAARAALDGFYARVASLTATSAGDPSARSAAKIQRQLARILIPVNYARDARFKQDPAETVAALPDLAVVRKLAAAEPGSHTAHAAEVSLKRGLNRLRWALRQAAATARGENGLDA